MHKFSRDMCVCVKEKMVNTYSYGQDATFGVRDELVRQGILASITVKGSYDTNRF